MDYQAENNIFERIIIELEYWVRGRLEESQLKLSLTPMVSSH